VWTKRGEDSSGFLLKQYNFELKAKEIYDKIVLEQEMTRKGGNEMAEQNERIIVVKSPEEIRAEDLVRLQHFRWIDDTFARVAFKDNPEIAQFVLRIITNISDLILDPCSFSTQYDAKRMAGSRSLMLDVHGGDTQGRKYDLEMEKSDASAERTEVHVATMIVEHLHEGDKFTDLSETYVIFMCEHDEVGNGRAVNAFSYRNDDLFKGSEEVEKNITPHAGNSGARRTRSRPNRNSFSEE